MERNFKNVKDTPFEIGGIIHPNDLGMYNMAKVM